MAKGDAVDLADNFGIDAADKVGFGDYESDMNQIWGFCRWLCISPFFLKNSYPNQLVTQRYF